MNQNVSFDIDRLGHERVLFMKLKMYPTFLIILCTGMKTNFDGFLKSRRRKNEPYQYDTTPIQNMRRKSELTPHFLDQESTNLDNFRKHKKGVNENVSGGFSRNEKVGRVWREGRVVPAITLHTSHSLVCIV